MLSNLYCGMKFMTALNVKATYRLEIHGKLAAAVSYKG